MGKAISTGSYYSIRKLRIKYSSLEDCFCGILGGAEKLVIQLNANNLANEYINGLLRYSVNSLLQFVIDSSVTRRKETWQRHSNQTLPNEPLVDLLPTKGQNQYFSFVRDIISADSRIARYSIRARPIDFYPLDLQDAFYQRCAKCKTESVQSTSCNNYLHIMHRIPKTVQACLKCSDFEHEYVQYFYQLYILLKDQNDDELIVSIDDQVSTQHLFPARCTTYLLIVSIVQAIKAFMFARGPQCSSSIS